MRECIGYLLYVNDVSRNVQKYIVTLLLECFVVISDGFKFNITRQQTYIFLVLACLKPRTCHILSHKTMKMFMSLQKIRSCFSILCKRKLHSSQI